MRTKKSGNEVQILNSQKLKAKCQTVCIMVKQMAGGLSVKCL
jgi:hypothetical protein